MTYRIVLTKGYKLIAERETGRVVPLENGDSITLKKVKYEIEKKEWDLDEMMFYFFVKII